MDAPTATLLAALAAAIASLLTLLLKTRTEWRAELRATNRKKLESLVDDIGDAMHKLVACCILKVRDQDTDNRNYWNDRIDDARKTLRRLRPRVRYQLWGLDEGLKALICLPDWTRTRQPHELSTLLDAASRLRNSLDEAIRRCYQRGRTPSLLERLRVRHGVSGLQRAAKDLGFLANEENLLEASTFTQKSTEYEKTYATVVEVAGEEFIAETSEGTRLVVKSANRSGKGSRSQLQIGTKVKLYQRDGEDFYRYRFIGG
jgi:hypothetical protein